MPLPRKKTRLEKALSFNQFRRRWGAKKHHQPDEDLAQLKAKIIDHTEVIYTHGSSKQLDTHLSALRQEFAQQSELLYYHAKLIVLIRRESDTDKHYARFKALWQQEGEYLIKQLNMRWLVSAADTVIDHDDDPVARSLAMSTVLLANTIKIQETERFISPNAPASPEKIEQLKNERVALFDGLSAFAVGTDDTLRNMRWRLNDVCGTHPMGQMLLEIFNRLQDQDSVYKRLRSQHTRPRTAWWD